MSIPPKKPLNPIDLSTHVSHKAHEWAVTERHPSEDDNAPPRSPYAPKRAYLRAATERHPVENDRDPLRSPCAPRQARAQPAVTSDFAARDDAGPLPPVRAPEGLRARIPSGMLSGSMSPIFGLMTRFPRTLGDTRSEPLNIATKT